MKQSTTFFFIVFLLCNNLAAFFPTQELSVNCQQHIRTKFKIHDQSLTSEYRFLAYQIIETLKTKSPTGFTLDEFHKAVESTQVIDLDKDYVQLNGHTVDAINYPDCTIIETRRHRSLCNKEKKSLIIVNKDSWELKNFDKKLENIMHEYLGISGKEKNVFSITHKNIHILQETKDRISRHYATFALYPILIEASDGYLNICRIKQEKVHRVRYWLNVNQALFPDEIANGYYIHMKSKILGEHSGYADIGTTYEHRAFRNFILDAFHKFQNDTQHLSEISIFRKNMLFEGIICRAILKETCSYPYGLKETQIIENALR